MIRFEDAPARDSKPAAKTKGAPEPQDKARTAEPSVVDSALDPGGSVKQADASTNLDLGDSPAKGRAKRKAPMRRAKKS